MTTFLHERILPGEAAYAAWRAERHGTAQQWDVPPIVEQLKAEAKDLGLWNLFRPGALSTLDFAPIAELTGWSVLLAPEAVNAMAPDVENMTMLDGYATEAQRARWLDPLLAGDIRSAFTVAEPDVASSDPTNIATTVRRDGEAFVVSGRKYFIANAPDARCRLFLVMGRTDPDAAPDRQHSILLVPRDAPGLEIVRRLPVFGFQDHHGYAELALHDVRVPASDVLGGEGDALAVLRSRQGAGLQFCMRLVGAAERAIDLMVRRTPGRFRRADRGPGRGAGADRAVTTRGRSGPPARPAGRMAARSRGRRRRRRRPGRDQGGLPAHGLRGDRPGHPPARRRRHERRHAAGVRVRLRPHDQGRVRAGGRRRQRRRRAGARRPPLSESGADGHQHASSPVLAHAGLDAGAHCGVPTRVRQPPDGQEQ